MQWQREQALLGVFLAVGGGTYCSLRARIKSLARHIMALKGGCGNMALWINDARFEYGPVELFLSPTPPSRQVTGVSIYLKKGGWAFIFELAGSGLSSFGLDNDDQIHQLETGEEEKDAAGVEVSS